MEQHLIITYDMSDSTLRNTVHRFLSDWGLNTQKSVFELALSASEVRKVVEFLRQRPLEPEDSIRIYRVCRSCLRKASALGEGLQVHLHPFEVL
jgi:CRISPR-associated protein Cas2